ncbi:anti-phage protein KwaB [Capnocytophaga canimorsus]|uniref:anti-phage protein KwaB n=1 Tax=Capnocytophaga canimorsus TaxID=28188 RepID=UPI00385ABB96
MNKQELDNALAFLNTPQGELQIILYALIDENSEPRKLDIKENDLPILQHMFVESIQSSITEKDNYTVLPLSTADERGNCFYQYDLELPTELQALENSIGNDNLENFSFSNSNFSGINSLIIVLADNENEIALFKKLSPVEIIGRGGFLFWKSNQRLERFDDQLLRISPKFHALRVGEEIVIIDLKMIEKSFGFHEVIIREATISLNAIRNLQLVSNIESLEELVNNITFARKLTKVARNSPVIQKNIPNADIIAFSKLHPLTKNKMRYTEDGTMFNLDTRISKDLLIKILNDDLLTSELTKLYYNSLAKDGVEIEEYPVEN